MLNHKKVKDLTDAQKLEIERLVTEYNSTKDIRALKSYVMPLHIVIEPDCCPMPPDNFVDWLRFLINSNYTTPN
jgi:hypothetical protein